MTMGLVLCLGTSACQPKSEPSDNEASQAQSTETPMIQTPKKPLESSESKMAVTAQTCLALNKAMEKIDDTSKIEAIYAVQKQLKACLPTASNAEVMALLKSYQTMYNRFLWDDSDTIGEEFNNDFFDVMSALEQHEKVPVESLKKMSPRVRYLIGLIQNDADVRVYNLGEGYYAFSHNLKTMADIFTPYLRQDQSKFIQRMAIDNQDTFWSDASVTVSFEELIERALFWENYIQQYPDGYKIKDAKYLLDFYRYIIFFGAENTQWTDDAIREFIMPEDEQMIQRLSKHPSSVLAKDSQNFLRFLALSDSERQQKYPAPSTDEEGREVGNWAIARYQLDKALQIPSIWDEIENKDCFNGLFCMDENKLW